MPLWIAWTKSIHTLISESSLPERIMLHLLSTNVTALTSSPWPSNRYTRLSRSTSYKYMWWSFAPAMISFASCENCKEKKQMGPEVSCSVSVWNARPVQLALQTWFSNQTFLDTWVTLAFRYTALTDQSQSLGFMIWYNEYLSLTNSTLCNHKVHEENEPSFQIFYM